jgi:hemerythrin-like domain-containing protein
LWVGDGHGKATVLFGARKTRKEGGIMSTLTEAIKHHHAQMERMLNRHVEALIEQRPDADPDGFVAFLKREVLPHARSEEAHLYPQADVLVREFERPTATMTIDHEFLANYAVKIEEAVRKLKHADAGTEAALAKELRRLAAEVAAILRLHLAKEERIYLPLFDQHMANERQLRLLEAIHETYQAEGASGSGRE